MKYRACFFFICISLIFLLPAYSVAEQKIYRVGISEYPRYAYKDATGDYAGCDVEYAYKIAQAANIKIEVVLIPDAQTYFNSIDDGRVDMLFDVLKTKEREMKYLYSEYETGSTPMSIYVRKDDDRFEYGNISQLHSLVFGSEIDSYVTKIFMTWCGKHNFTPVVKEYADSGEVNVALERKEIDAGIYGTESVEGYRTILQFEPTPYFIIFRKGNAELKAKIDDAMGTILSVDPLYKRTLVEKYSNRDYEIDALTNQESQYLVEHPQIKVAVIKNDEPYYSIKDGVPKGIFPEYFSEFSKLIHSTFVFIPYKTQNEAIDALKRGDADILAMYSDGLISAYTSELRLTNPYATVNTMMVTRRGTATNTIMKIVVKDRNKGIIEKSFGKEKRIEWFVGNTAYDCFTAVKKGKADAMVCGLPSATWLINQTNSSAYNTSTVSGITIDLCSAVSYENINLCTILNKLIKATVYKFNGIVSRNSLQESDWQTTIARIPPVCLFVFSFILLLAVIMLVLALFVLISRQKEKVLLEKERIEYERREAQIEEQSKSTEIRNMFFSNISHDMRTPLNAIIGFSNLALKNEVSSETRDYLGKIQSSGKLLLELIDDTLTLSKMNSGKLRLNPLPVDSNELFEPLILPVRASAELKHIIFTVTNTSQRRIVLADSLNVQKILLNLLSNAVKYTCEGGTVLFSITDKYQEGKENSFVFKISDTGIGISPSFLPHIYEPFVQENRSADISAGTGLGLSIVKNLVDMMGGKITVDSVLNKGTTFTVELTLKETEEQPDVHTLGEASPNLSGRKVLLCEDNTLNSEIAIALLKAQNITVDHAVNGEIGVTKFVQSKEHEYAAILMDLRMPVMNGYEAAKTIRRLERDDAKEIPIIAMTADAFEDDARKCFEAGMNAHITKPIDPEKMYRALSMLIVGK